jgi:hypothetical protein
MAPSVVYLQRAEFAEFPYEQFRDRLRHLQKKITSCKNRTSFDVAALGVPVNWQNECVCPLFEKNRASQVAFGKRLKLSKNLLKLKRLKLKRLKL